METIGEKIRFYRTRKGLTLRKLAEICGIAAPALSDYENNKVIPRRDKHGHRVQDFSKWYKGQHEAIISFETYKEVMNMRARQSSARRISLFNKMIYCPYCEHNLSVRYRKYKKGTSVYYSCLPVSYKGKACYQSIKENYLEALLLENVDKFFNLKIPTQKSRQSIQEQVKKIDMKISKAIDLIDIDSMSSEDIRKKIEELKKQKEKLLSEKPTIDYKKLAEKFKNIKDVYQYALPEEKKELWNILIDRIIAYKDKLEIRFKDGSISNLKKYKVKCGGDERGVCRYK